MEQAREPEDVRPTTAALRPMRWRRRFEVCAVLAVVACCVFLGVAEYVLHHAGPILRERIAETLAARFGVPVELDRVEISLFRGIAVDGYGLRIPSGRTVANSPPDPLMAVQHFAFRTSWRGVLHEPTHVAGVRVEGMEIHIPPASRRGQLSAMSLTQEALSSPTAKARNLFAVDELRCRDVTLILETDQPRKDPLVFRIASVDLRNIGPGQAMVYEAALTNPKPAGVIHAAGHFGPWGGAGHASGRTADPGQTPVDGEYTFDHAEMSSIRGLRGTLSSTGRFAGVLNRMMVDGSTEIPDFALDISDHPLPLHTDFHAVVDATSGDTFLEPVHARLAGSEFTTSGRIVKVKGQGHDIALDIDIVNGRIEDFLRLATKTNPPLLHGSLSMKAKLHIPPGRARVAMKMGMSGMFQIGDAVFNNARLQDRMDKLSARAQGHPEEVRAAGEDRRRDVRSHLGASFTLGRGVLSVTDVHYSLPGATMLLNGVYSMDGRLFEFKGHVRTEATASEMVGGWKGMLLKPLDRYLQKGGAGVELPVVISGTEGDMQVGLAMGGTDATPRAMLAEIRGKEHGKRELQAARDEAALADREDAAAAKAPSLAAAEEMHNAAVRHRAEAQRRAAQGDGGGARP